MGGENSCTTTTNKPEVSPPFCFVIGLHPPFILCCVIDVNKFDTSHYGKFSLIFRGRGQNEAGWLEAKDLLKRIVDGPTAENKAIWLGEGRDLTPFQDEILSKFVPPMLTFYPRMKVRVHLSDYLSNVINKGDSAEKNNW